MKRKFQIVRHNPNEFDLQQLDVIKARIASLKESCNFIGAQFVFDEVVFQIVGIQYNLDLNEQVIALAQVTSKEKSVIQKPSLVDINKLKNNGG